jgi:hypothetical protein
MITGTSAYRSAIVLRLEQEEHQVRARREVLAFVADDDCLEAGGCLA